MREDLIQFHSKRLTYTKLTTASGPLKSSSFNENWLYGWPCLMATEAEESWAAPIAEMPWQYLMACLDPCWSLQALVFQEEVEACGIYLSLELVMTIRNETCIVHYYLPLCCGSLFKFTAAPCVAWSELHAAGRLCIDDLWNSTFCAGMEPVI